MRLYTLSHAPLQVSTQPGPTGWDIGDLTEKVFDKKSFLVDLGPSGIPSEGVFITGCPVYRGINFPIGSISNALAAL